VIVRRITILIALGILGASLSACNVGSPAASVNGTDISQSQIQNEINQVADNSTVRCALGVMTGATIPSQGAVSGTVPTEIVDAELTNLIDQVLYTQELSKLHSPVDSTYLTYARNFFPQELTPSQGSSACGLTGSGLMAKLPSWFVTQQVGLLAAEEKLLTVVGHVNLGQSGVLAFYNKNPSDFEQLCMNAIATSTQAEANAAEAKLKAGQSFATVAAAGSLNSDLSQFGFTASGAFQCEPSSYVVQYQPNWAEALDAVSLKPGVIAAPFQDSAQSDYNGTNDWIVLDLAKRGEAPLTSQVSLEIQEYLVSQNVGSFSKEQAKIFHNASVTVDPEFGTWRAVKKGSLPDVEPPATPKADYLLNGHVDLGTS
jgi:hypothetical protein